MFGCKNRPHGRFFFNFHLVYGQKYDKIYTNISVGIADLTEGIMKKLLFIPMFLSACLCSMMASTTAFADRNCPATSQQELSDLQDGRDDEFIFSNRAVADELYNCYRSDKENNTGKVCPLTKGSVWECDKRQGCNVDTYLLGKTGMLQSQKGSSDYKSVDGKILKCVRQATGDSWTRHEYITCPANSNGWTKISLINSSSANCYYHSCYTTQGNYCKEAYCCGQFSGGGNGGGGGGGNTNPCPGKELERIACRGQGDVALWHDDKCWCECKDNTSPYWTGQTCKKCPSGSTYDRNAKTCNCTDSNKRFDAEKFMCVEKGGGDSHDCGNDATWNKDKCVCKNPIYKFNESNKTCAFDLKTCQEARKGNKEGVACCEVNDATWSHNKCVCNDASKHFVLDGSHGRCVANDITPDPDPNPDPDPEIFVCPEDYMNALRGKYKSCNKYVEALAALERYCLSDGRNSDGFWMLYHEIENIIPECESDTVIALVTKINSKLTGWKDSLTVWKNKEGKFNTARLASDSIAGVVLGTAGGLITSSVVKKNQVKAGFEDINCTIGGQKVADWHDEFTVGIQ